MYILTCPEVCGLTLKPPPPSTTLPRCRLVMVSTKHFSWLAESLGESEYCGRTTHLSPDDPSHREDRLIL